MFEFLYLNSTMHFRKSIFQCLLRGEGGRGWDGGDLGGGLTVGHAICSSRGIRA